MTSELMAANSANREALAKLVKFEVDRALGGSAWPPPRRSAS
jgi:hypothetical protein